MMALFKSLEQGYCICSYSPRYTLVVRKDSHISGLVNEGSRCLDCRATDYDIIMELSGAKQSMLYRSDVVMTSLWSKVEHLLYQ